MTDTLRKPAAAMFSRSTCAMPLAGSTAVTCAALPAKGTTRLPGPAPISSTRQWGCTSASSSAARPFFCSLPVMRCQYWRASAISSQFCQHSMPRPDARDASCVLRHKAFQYSGCDGSQGASASLTLCGKTGAAHGAASLLGCMDTFSFAVTIALQQNS